MNTRHDKVNNISTIQVTILIDKYNKFINNNKSAFKNKLADPELITYGLCGTSAPMYKENNPNNKKLYDGGAPQFNPPIPIDSLIDLGVLWDEKI